MRYFNEALAANGERTDGVYGDRGLEAWPEARVADVARSRGALDGALGRAADARTRKICADHAARVEARCATSSRATSRRRPPRPTRRRRPRRP